jgi:uncharacterized OB-fold protein
METSMTHPMAALADTLTAPWWDQVEHGVFAMPRCGECARWHFHPQPRCPHCRSAALTWQAASGRGQVHSFTVVHRAPSPAFAADVPYTIAIIETEEGPHLMTRLVGIEPDRVHVGLPVSARIGPLAPEGMPLVLFEPLDTEG